MVVTFCVFLVTLPSLHLSRLLSLPWRPPHIHWAKLTLIHSNPYVGSLSLTLGLHLVVFVSLQESIIWHGALTGSKWGYPPWPNGKTCCPLGRKVREHECISLFPVLLFPLIWSIRLGTHTQPPFICHAALSRVTVQIKAFGMFLENAVYLLFTDCMCHEVKGMTSLFVALLFFSSLTIHGCSFGKDGDGSLGHSLLANHRGDFGTPAVWTHPQEVTRLVAPFGCIQNSSDQEEKKKVVYSLLL